MMSHSDQEVDEEDKSQEREQGRERDERLLASTVAAPLAIPP